MSKDTRGKTTTGSSSGGGAGGTAPGRTSKTQHLPPSTPRTSLLLDPEAMPDRPPDTRMSDDPFGMHLAAAERGPDGHQSTDALEREAVEQELAWLIANADWRKLRVNAVAPAAKAPRARAQARRDGTAPDLGGVASVLAVDQLAAAIKGLQRQWSTLSAADRSAGVKRAIDEVLALAQVPPLAGIEEKEGYRYQASFNFREWRMFLRKELIAGGELGERDASDLCETLAHEARHGEQYFLVARRLSMRGFGPEEIASQMHGMHLPTVERAFELGLVDSPAEEAFAEKLEPAVTTEADVTALLDRSTGSQAVDRMKAARETAQAALDGMRAQPATVTLGGARAACQGLREQVENVLLDYVIYTQFPVEADAAEAGAGGALAFEALP